MATMFYDDDADLAALADRKVAIIGSGFAGLGMAGTTFMRSFVDFDYVNIALMPLFAGILSVGAVKGAENYPRYLPFEWWALVGGVVVVLYLVTLLLAAADRRKLDEDGHAYPAHGAWAFLTAPVYLIARTLAVKRETGRTSVLLWVWLVFAALLVGGYFLTDYLAPGLLAAYTLPFL